MSDTDVRCHVCGDRIHTMLGIHHPPDDAYVAVRGQWMWVPEMDAAVFVLDPDSDMTIVALPNGQMALITDEGNQPTLHVHAVCQELLMREEQLGFDFEWDEEDIMEVTHGR